MKKVIAILLVFLMVFSITACAGNDAVRGQITGSNNGSSEKDKEFSTGKLNSQNYTNSFVGISCELGSDWVYLSEEQIRENNQLALGLMGDDYVKAIQNASTFTDMMATHSNQMDTVNVTFEKLTGVNLTLTEAQYVALSKDAMVGALESMGMSNIQVTTGEAPFAGANHAYIAIKAQFSGVAVYERLAVVKCQNYIVIVTSCTWQVDNCKNILDTFKAA